MPPDAAAVPQADPLGAVIDGRYRLDGVIAKGGTATVYRATHVGTERLVAVKILHAALLTDRVAVKRFLAEAKVASRLPHPNIIDVLDVGRDARGCPYLVTELLEGETLAAYLARVRGPLPVEDVPRLILPLLDALATTHASGIIHRDFKPENVMLFENGDGTATPKLLDFGISKELARDDDDDHDELTAPGVAVGTPHYISPEQAFGRGALDARADVWSAGVVLYRVLTGRVPFDGANMSQLLSRLRETIPPSPAAFGAPPALSAIVMRCLAKEPAERPQDARMLKALLCEAFGLPTTAGAPSRVSLPAIQIAATPEVGITVRPGARSSHPHALPGALSPRSGVGRPDDSTGAHGRPRLLLEAAIPALPSLPRDLGASAVPPRATITPVPPALVAPSSAHARVPRPARAPRGRGPTVWVLVAAALFGLGVATGWIAARATPDRSTGRCASSLSTRAPGP